MKPFATLLRSLRAPLLVVGLALLGTGCDWTMKYVNFPVVEPDGRKVYYEKFFNDGLGSDADMAAAYNAVERGDVDTALRICEGKTAQSNADKFDWYNLAILYEVRGRWDDAEHAINEAIRLDAVPAGPGKQRVDADFIAERNFIQRHKK